MLDLSINSFIEHLLNVSTPQRRAVIDATGQNTTTRCGLLKKLASIDPPSPEWFAALETLINPVSDSIAPLRNRLIHDVWVQGETIKQWDDRSNLMRIKAGSPRILSDPKYPKRELVEIWELVQKIKAFSITISKASMEYVIWKQTGQMPQLPRLPE